MATETHYYDAFQERW